MAQEYREVEEELEIPKNTGITGLLTAIKRLAELPRMQMITIDGRRGKTTISYKRYAMNGEPDRGLNLDFESLSPYALLRNGTVQEVRAASKNAAVVVAQLFGEVSKAGLWPMAFVSGAQSVFWAWHMETTGVDAFSSYEDAYGLPFLTDRQIEDDVLMLAAAFSRNASLIDVHQAFKLTIPHRGSTTPPTTVEVIQ